MEVSRIFLSCLLIGLVHCQNGMFGSIGHQQGVGQGDHLSAYNSHLDALLDPHGIHHGQGACEPIKIGKLQKLMHLGIMDIAADENLLNIILNA